MNILLWVFQIMLALQAFAGGAFKVFKFDELQKVPAAATLSQSAWAAIGVFEMACAVLLILPTAMNRMRILTPLAAAAFAVESLALAALYARYSLTFTATNPLVWVLAAALMAAFIAYGRYSLKPRV